MEIKQKGINNECKSLTRLDYPDLSMIRVEDTYYMVSTTMHFMPGCEILQSFDLVHWEHVTMSMRRWIIRMRSN